MGRDLVEHLAQADAVERHAERQDIALLGRVATAELQRINVEGFGQFVHQGIHGKPGRRPARRPIGGHPGFVGDHVIALGVQIGQLVRRQADQQAARDRRAGKRPGVVAHDGRGGRQLAVLFGPGLDRDDRR